VSSSINLKLKKDPLAQWRIKYDSDFVVRNIVLPEDSNDIPRILGWSGPARSGTTALLYLLAGHPKVDHAYFQPQKTLMRLGGPPMVLRSSDKLVCMKETFFSWDKVDELDDPIDVLLRAGVPPEKITWIFMLRDPRQTFASWGMLSSHSRPDPVIYSLWQRHTVNLWRKYKDSKVKVVPFVYELLRNQEEVVVSHLLARVGLDYIPLKLDFNKVLIDQKFVPGQATSEDYVPVFQETHNHEKYVYSTNMYPTDSKAVKMVVALCQKEYEDFAKISEKVLDLHLI
jgi:hypothetical protein